MSDLPEDRPMIVAQLVNPEHASGIISHEVTDLSVRLTFTGMASLREIVDLITRVGGAVRNEDQVCVVLPATWSLYVSPAILKAIEDHGGYRVEGG